MRKSCTMYTLEPSELWLRYHKNVQLISKYLKTSPEVDPGF